MTRHNVAECRISLSKLSLFRKNNADRFSSIGWTIDKGYPKLITYINGSDKSVTGRDNMIIAPLSFMVLNTIVSAMEDIYGGKPDNSLEVKCYGHKWENNARSNDIEMQATIVIGKDEKGINYIETRAVNKPNMRFNLVTPDKYYKIMKDGVDITNTAEGSNLFSKSYVKQLSHVINIIANDSNVIQVIDRPTINTSNGTSSDELKSLI